jgi:2,4-dienoyl-CoA reductase-like NADH-dependent reductase (Old Yellow Enzyme family)
VSKQSAAKPPRPTGRLSRLLNEPDRHRVAIEFPIARLDRGDDDEDGIQDPEDRREKEADQIVRMGQADVVLMAREFLRHPNWPLHAAGSLHQKVTGPAQYGRAFS